MTARTRPKYPWVQAHGSRAGNNLLHIKDLNFYEKYESGTVIMRSLCGVFSSRRPLVSNIDGYKLCEACLYVATRNSGEDSVADRDSV